MKKIRFFLDPLSDIEVWLNKTAHNGYRLKALHNFIYDFEKTDKAYTYSTQFIAANSESENNDYIRLLKENGTRVFRAPLNQGNIALGKVRIRPYAHGTGKIANSFQGYNKEILIVENAGTEAIPLLTNKADLAELYKNIRNAYLQGFVVLLVLLVFSVYKSYETNFEITKLIISALVGLVTLLIATLLFKAQNNYKKYKEESELSD